MRKIDEVLDVIEQWISESSVGNLVLYHPPKVMKFGAYVEQTIKAREMNDETREALETLVRNLGATRGEFFTNDEGEPDRVKIVKVF
jgi:hypothetical protein